jgi:predicted metal-dependent hydrolase
MIQDSNDISDIKITRSLKRRKTIGAQLINNILHVYAPHNISDEKLDKIIISFKQRFTNSLLKKKLNNEKPLKEIAEIINKKYLKNRLDISSISIEYVTGQTHKFGCCNYQNKSIRISHQIAKMPDWVRDYVIMHELSHLIEPNHSKLFWDIVSEYKLAERAKGYLIAKGMELHDNNNATEGGMI